MNVEELLTEQYEDRIFTVEDNTVWVSGMNARCRIIAERMAKTLVSHDIPASLVRDDDATQFGGVEFDYGTEA